MHFEAYNVFGVILPELLQSAAQTFGLCVGIVIICRSAGFLNLASAPLALAGAGVMASCHLIFGSDYAGSILIFVILCAVLIGCCLMIIPIRARAEKLNLLEGAAENLDVSEALRRSLLSFAAALAIAAFAHDSAAHFDLTQRLRVPISDAAWSRPDVYSRYWVILASVFATLLAAQVCLVFWQDEITRSRKRPAIIFGLSCTMFSGAIPILAGIGSPDTNVGTDNSTAALMLAMSLGSGSVLNLGLAALAWAIILYLNEHSLHLVPYLPVAFVGVFGLISANAAARTLGTPTAIEPARWRWVDLTLFAVVLAATNLLPLRGADPRDLTLPLTILGLNFFRLPRDRICLCGPLFCSLGAAIAYNQSFFYGLPASLVIIVGGILAGAACYFFLGRLSEMNFLATTFVLSYIGNSAIPGIVGNDGLTLQETFHQSQFAPIVIFCFAALGLLFWLLQAKIQKVSNSTRLDFCSFLIGSVSLVLAGALSAWFSQVIGPDQFSIERGAILAGLTLVAGRSSITGALVASVLGIYLLAQVRLFNLTPALFAATILGIGLVLFPQGVWRFGRRQRQAGQADNSGLLDVSA